jgi:hypothetical protein
VSRFPPSRYLQVEDTYFSVHKYFFERESSFFSHVFNEEPLPGRPARGSSESYPVVLDDVSKLGMRTAQCYLPQC